MAGQFATVDDYIRSFPEDVRATLERVRRTIRAVVPTGDEVISYEIPTVRLDGKYLVYFAGWKHHVSVYPIPAGDEAFQRDLAPYRAGKGTAKFALNRPVPYDLITRLVTLLVQERKGNPA
jgi:uncharacterized protein YdhG (YjbR/CyaY superfamily)